MIIYIKNLLKLLGAEKSKLLLIISLMIISSVIDLLGIGLLGPFIAIIFDEKILDNFQSFLKNYHYFEKNSIIIISGVLILIIFLIKSIFSIYINSYLIKFGLRIQLNLRKRIISGFQEIPYEHLLKKNRLHYVQSIQNLTDQFSVLIQAILRAIGDVIIAILIIGLLAYTNFSALVILTAILVFSSITYDIFFRRDLKKYGAAANQGLSKMLASVHEAIEGYKEIKLLGLEGFFRERVLAGCKEYSENFSKAQIISTTPRFYLELMIVLFLVSLIFYAVLFESDQAQLIATLTIFSAASLRLMPIANSVLLTLNKIRYSSACIDTLNEDLSYQNLEKCIIHGEEKFDNLIFENVNFSYARSNNQTLKNVSIQLKSGDFIAIVGDSGAGKSTLINLIIGLINPISGRVLFNGKDIKNNILSWHKKIAYVPQETFLIDDTFKKNIVLSDIDSDFNDEQFNISITKVKLGSLMSRLPDGIDGIIGANGKTISGGQRQRIALARAIYFKRNILVLDEPTSALDHQSEREIMQEVFALRGELTVIMVTHNRQLVSNFDRVYEIKNGNINLLDNIEFHE